MGKSNLNTSITPFLMRKSYTGSDLAGDIAIRLGLLTLEQCNDPQLKNHSPASLPPYLPPAKPPLHAVLDIHTIKPCINWLDYAANIAGAVGG